MSDGSVVFEATSVMVEVERWYAVTGAPVFANKFQPISAEFIFMTTVDSGLSKMPVKMRINARVIKDDGTMGDEFGQIPDLSARNNHNWPQWLHDLFKLACEDQAASV